MYSRETLVKRRTSETREPVLHPYVRISDPTQRKGGGLDRQTSADVAGFASHFGFIVSKRVRIDDGVSAFRGLNATPDHELGQFLDEARRGLVQPGDCLLLENYDRLSRQDPWAAIGLVQQLRELGIHVGRLDRRKLLRSDSTDYGDFFEAAVEFMRGNSESAAKSYRNKDRWAKKREAAREGGTPITGRVPAWIVVKDGQIRLIPERAEAIRRAFELLTNGYGTALAARQLNIEGVKAIGTSPRWSRSYLSLLANDRRVLGEFQPRTKDGLPDGEPIKSYFPALLTEAEFYACRSAMRQRGQRPGRVTQRVELFSGLMKNARDGEAYYTVTRTERSGSNRVLNNATAEEARSRSYSFPLPTFEKAMLSALREVDYRRVLGNEREDDEVSDLANQFAGLEAKEAEVEAEMVNGDVPAFARVLRTIADQKKDVGERLSAAREKAANPLSESWGRCHSLIDALESAPNPIDARLRLRKEIQRIVDAIYILVVPRGRDRLCAVQLFFTEGQRQRSLMIFHRPPKANQSAKQEGRWDYATFAKAGVKGEFDLREARDVAELEHVLTATELP